MLYQKTGKCAMAASVGGDNLGTGYASIFHCVKLKLFSMSKVLKNFSVFVCDCNFHNTFSFFMLWIGNRKDGGSRSLATPTVLAV